MSMTRQYTRIDWKNAPNDTTPINDVNLNNMDAGIYNIEGNIISLDTTKANQSEVLECLSSVYIDGVYHRPVEYNTETGVFHFYMKNGTVITVDLNVEKIPISFTMSDKGVITMQTADGTIYTADIGAMIKNVAMADSDTIVWTATPDDSGNIVWTASVKAGSINGTHLQTDYLSDCINAKEESIAAASGSQTSALRSEGYAVGKQNDVVVPADSPYHENNAQYYASKASESKEIAETAAATSVTESNKSETMATTSIQYSLVSEGWANGTQNGVKVTSGSPYYHESSYYHREKAKTYASNAEVSAGNAYESENNALQYKISANNSANRATEESLEAEGYAVGTQNGTPVTSESKYYHNNAKYYSDKASGSTLEALTDVSIDNKQNGQALVWNGTAWTNGSVAPKTVSGTLAKNATSITFSDSSIKADSILRLYAENKILAPKSVSVASGSVTYTFKAQTTATNMKLEIVGE